MQSDFHLKVNNQGLVCFGFICNCPTIKRHIIYCANTLAALIFLKKKRERESSNNNSRVCWERRFCGHFQDNCMIQTHNSPLICLEKQHSAANEADGGRRRTPSALCVQKTRLLKGNSNDTNNNNNNNTKTADVCEPWKCRLVAQPLHRCCGTQAAVFLLLPAGDSTAAAENVSAGTKHGYF